MVANTEGKTQARAHTHTHNMHTPHMLTHTASPAHKVCQGWRASQDKVVSHYIIIILIFRKITDKLQTSIAMNGSDDYTVCPKQECILNYRGLSVYSISMPASSAREDSLSTMSVSDKACIRTH